MPRPTVEITHALEFSAAHRLHNPKLSDEENLRIFGVCNNAYGHGHNYWVEVTVTGEVPEDTGMVMNLNDLMGLMRERLFEKLDHKHLNHDVEFLAGMVPTAENIAIAIWGELESEIDRLGARLWRVRLFESKANRVDYYGPAGRSR